MIPFAPGLFSTTTAWRVRVSRYCAKVRAVMSPEPPGPKGTTIFTGLAGYGCAAADPATPSRAIHVKNDFMESSGAELGTKLSCVNWEGVPHPGFFRGLRV